MNVHEKGLDASQRVCLELCVIDALNNVPLFSKLFEIHVSKMRADLFLIAQRPLTKQLSAIKVIQ